MGVMIYYVYVVGMNELKNAHRFLNEGLPFHNRNINMTIKLELFIKYWGKF